MSLARRFPFGEEPVATLAQPTRPLPPLLPPPPDALATMPLVDFIPPAGALPFHEPLPEPAPPVEVLSPLVPPPPVRMPRARVSFKNAAALVLLVLDILVLAYLAATWRP